MFKFLPLNISDSKESIYYSQIKAESIDLDIIIILKIILQHIQNFPAH